MANETNVKPRDIGKDMKDNAAKSAAMIRKNTKRAKQGMKPGGKK